MLISFFRSIELLVKVIINTFFVKDTFFSNKAQRNNTHLRVY